MRRTWGFDDPTKHSIASLREAQVTQKALHLNLEM